MWDFGASVYRAYALGATASLYELQQRRVALERMLADKNDLMKRLSAAGDEAGAKAVRKEYIELTKARDILYGQIKASNKGFLPPSPTAPSVAARTEPVLIVRPGECYDGPVPKGHFKRGEMIGSEESFNIRHLGFDYIIVRSAACDSGWMAVDPEEQAKVRPAARELFIRRRGAK